MEFFGYAGAIIMGLLLGLIGGGGSILTVPIFVYLFGLDPVASTAYSLFVVGLTSLVGSLSYLKSGNIHLKTALVFGAPSIVSVFVVRKFVIPIIPDPLFASSSLAITKPLFIMVLFAVLMLMAAVSMIRKPKNEPKASKIMVYNYPLIFGEGLLVGAVTGMVGAGGGFLIIPALVFLTGLPMKQAVGTSLLIIAMKSLIGFTGDMSAGLAIDFGFLLAFSAFAVVGIVIGSLWIRYIANEKLKQIFGWTVLVMAIYILCKEVLF